MSWPISEGWSRSLSFYSSYILWNPMCVCTTHESHRSVTMPSLSFFSRVSCALARTKNRGNFSHRCVAFFDEDSVQVDPFRSLRWPIDVDPVLSTDCHTTIHPVSYILIPFLWSIHSIHMCLVIQRFKVWMVIQPSRQTMGNIANPINQHQLRWHLHLDPWCTRRRN